MKIPKICRTAYLTYEIDEELTKFCAVNHISRSQAISDAVEAYIASPTEPLSASEQVRNRRDWPGSESFYPEYLRAKGLL